MNNTSFSEPTVGKPKTAPRDFFLYFGSMILLYASAIVFLQLLFAYINYLFPDALSYSFTDGLLGNIRFPLSALIVLFPFFVFLSSRVSRDVHEHPEKREMGVRKWLVFFTLFITAAVVIGDLIVLLNTFLSGETTARFLLKVLAVFAVSAGAFWYFFLEAKGKGSEKMYRRFIVVCSVAVIASVVGGFLIVGSPAKERTYQLDARRVSDLQSIQWQVVNYWQAKKKLPENLSELKDPISGIVIPVDPETREAYQYTKKGALVFSLCATFSLPSREDQTSKPVPSPTRFSNDENWNHEARTYCFERPIDPDRYPPTGKGLFLPASD